VNWSEYYEQTSDIPMVHISGWYDNYCGTAIHNYLRLSGIKRSPIRLLLGHWIHGGIAQAYGGEVDFGSDAAITDFTNDWHMRWFDHFLKEKDNGVGAEPAIKLFIMGTGDGHKDENGRLFHGGYWRTEENWPLSDTQFANYYFHGDGTLRKEMPGPNEQPTTYTYDPRHPVPTIGGSMAASEPLYVGGAFDQREREYKGDPQKGFYGSRPPYLPLKARHDVVVFQTEPLKEDIEVTGPITVKLHASSNAPDTDFTAKLIDVYPPSKDFPSGFEMNLTDGIIRARYRNSPESQELMMPGEIYLFTIEPFGTANVFKKGHRIRIDISSSNFPRFDVNPNTGEPLGLNRRSIKADNTIYHDESHPSHVILPIIPSRK
jgi:predicted acyl esterase